MPSSGMSDDKFEIVGLLAGFNKPPLEDDTKMSHEDEFNPRLTKLLFVTRLTKGGCYNPLPRFSEPNPLWNWFWRNQPM